MVELKKGMEFNAPDDVLRFFDALDKQHQASLALLTPEVLSWLKKKRCSSLSTLPVRE
jgi:hypothetical protein